MFGTGSNQDREGIARFARADVDTHVFQTGIR
jgi:hypothetical protein